MPATQPQLRGGDTTTGSGLLHRPLWLLSGQLGVVIAVFLGFGAMAGFKPKLVALMLVCCAVGAISLGSERPFGRIVVTTPVAAILMWWVLSYLWTYNIYGWWTDTQLTIPLVVTCVALAGLLPTHDFARALVVGCYLAIGYTLLQLLLHPGTATFNPDGLPGWRGGFIHKNAMAPFMVFAVLVLVCFEARSRHRTAAILTALVMIVMSQSTSALIAGFVVLVVTVFVRGFASSATPARASLIAGGICGAFLIATLSSTILPLVLQVRGKDASLTGRRDIWHEVWHAITLRPWFGYGIGGVWSNPSNDPARTIVRNLGFVVFHSHDGFLEILLVLGVVGLALYVWLMISTVRVALANLRQSTPMAVMAVGYITLIAMYSISEVAVFGIWLAMLAAFSSVVTRIDVDRRRAMEASTSGSMSAER